MKKYFIAILVLVNSCKLLPHSDEKFVNIEGKSLQLSLNPADSSQYYYDILNRSDIHLEAEGKEVDNKNNSTVGMYFNIDKVASGNYLLTTIFDKILLSMKSEGVETNADAQNASFSQNPIEKMLGALKTVPLQITINPMGDVLHTEGYEELNNNLLKSLNIQDSNSRNVIQQQLKKFIGEGMVQKNLEKLFKIFPDSAVYICEKWKLNTKQTGDFNVDIHSRFQLKDINEDIALIQAESDMESDNTPIQMMGYSGVPHLKGTQKAEYSMEAKTGMLINASISAVVDGTTELLGKEAPIEIKNSTQIKGKRIN